MKIVRNVTLKDIQEANKPLTDFIDEDRVTVDDFRTAVLESAKYQDKLTQAEKDYYENKISERIQKALDELETDEARELVTRQEVEHIFGAFLEAKKEQMLETCINSTMAKLRRDDRVDADLLAAISLSLSELL